MSFDTANAIKEGYTYREIADFLASKANFDVSGARKEGYSDEELVRHLASKQVVPETSAGTYDTFDASASPDIFGGAEAAAKPPRTPEFSLPQAKEPDYASAILPDEVLNPPAREPVSFDGKIPDVRLAGPTGGEVDITGASQPVPAKQDVLGGAKVYGEQIWNAIPNVVASTLIAVKGVSGANVRDEDKNIIDWAIQNQNEYNKRLKGEAETKYGKDTYVGPFNISEDVATLGQNLGFSGASALAGIPAGILAGTATTAVTGNPVAGAAAGYAAGGTASGIMAYRIASFRYMQDILEKADQEKRARTGEGLTSAEQNNYKKKWGANAIINGLAEALPEAIGNVGEFRVLMGTAKKELTKKTLIPIITGLLKMGGIELGTETVTEQFQQPLAVQAGLQSGPERSLTSPEDWAKSFDAVLMPTILQMATMGPLGFGAGRTNHWRNARAIKNIANNEEGLSSIPNKELSNIAGKVAFTVEARPNDEKLLDAGISIASEFVRRRQAAQEQTAGKVAGPPSRNPDALTPEFFQAIQTFIADGQDNEGNPFTVDDAANMLDAYKRKPGADPASVQAFEGVIGTAQPAAVTSPESIVTPPIQETPAVAPDVQALETFKAALNDPKAFTNDRDIMAAKGVIATQHPHLIDDLNKAIIEHKGSKLKDPTWTGTLTRPFKAPEMDLSSIPKVTPVVQATATPSAGEIMQPAVALGAEAGGIAKTPAPEPGSKAFVENKIQELGSIEAVNAFYSGNDLVSDYARTMAPKILGGTNTGQTKGKKWQDAVLSRIDRDVFKDVVSQSIQKDGQRLIDAANKGDIATLESISEKYIRDSGRDQGGGGAGPGKVKGPRSGAVAVYDTARWAIDKIKAETGDAPVASGKKSILPPGKKVTAPTIRDKAAGAENIVTLLQKAGKIRLEEYKDRNASAWERAHGKRGKDVSREFPDVAAVSSDNGTMTMGEAADLLNQEGVTRPAGHSEWTADNLWEVLKSGNARNYFTPVKQESKIDQEIGELYDAETKRVLAIAEEEGIDPGAVREVEDDLSRVVIEEIRNKTELSEDEVPFLTDELDNTFDAFADAELTESEKAFAARDEETPTEAPTKPLKGGTNESGFLAGLSDTEDFELSPPKGEVYQGPLKVNKPKPKQGGIFDQEEKPSPSGILDLKGRWSSQAIERIDKEGNEIPTGPAMGQLYSSRMQYSFAGEGKPSADDIRQLQDAGFKKTGEDEWTGPVKLAEGTRKDTAENIGIPIIEEGKEPTSNTEDAGKLESFGEKVGGSRADTAERGFSMAGKEKKEESGPAWRKKYVAMEHIDGTGWTIGKTGDRFGISARASQKFATQEEAEAAIPAIAVQDSHRVYQGQKDSGYSIFKKVGEKKLFKVVNQEFPSREEATKHMVEHAEEILNIKANFGEEILPVPDHVQRKGVERRTKDATPEMIMETFGPRAIEFGNWNNQEERQLLLNHFYDSALDLADVLNLPPKALFLNGELALAFGARGHGLSGAKAHYERDYGIINLTKMSGAGSLAHELWHAYDHYFARLDTKAKSEKVKNARGDMVYPVASKDMDYQSHGASYTSQLRQELKDAYISLMESMYKKAEQYVEDTKKVDQLVGTARENLRSTMDSVRTELSRDLTNYHKSKGGYSGKSIKFFEPASAEQLAEFDRLANILIEGGNLETKYKANEKMKGMFAGRQTNDTLESMNAILKAARNRQGFNKERTGSLDRVRAAMGTYSARLKMFEDARAGTEKTKKVPTSYAIEAKKMDQARSGDYWSEPHEMAARAFAAYVEDKIAEQGGQSDFLVYHAHGGILLPMIDGFVARPYPEGAERVAINKLFDTFIGEIKTRETDKGVQMYMPEQSDAGRLGGDRERTPEEHALIDAVTDLRANEPEKGYTPEEVAASYEEATGEEFPYRMLLPHLEKLGTTISFDSRKIQNRSGAAAVYDPGTNEIIFNEGTLEYSRDVTAKFEEVVSHEAIHAIVVNLEETNMPAYIEFKTKINGFFEDLKPHIDRADYYTQMIFDKVAEKNLVDEIVNLAFTNAGFAKWLDSISSTKGVKDSQTLWGKLKEIILNALGKVTHISKTKLDELNQIMDSVMVIGENLTGESASGNQAAMSKTPGKADITPKTNPEAGGEVKKAPPIEELLKKSDVPVTVLMGDELTGSKSIDDIRKAAELHIQKMQGKPLRNDDTGWDLVIGRRDREKLVDSYDQSISGLRALAGIKNLVKEAVLAETHGDVKGNPDVNAVHRMYVPVIIGDKIYRTKLTVKEYKAGRNNLHSLEAIEMENPAAYPPIRPNNLRPEMVQPAGFRVSIATLLENARKNDGELFISDSSEPLPNPSRPPEVGGRVQYSNAADQTPEATLEDVQAIFKGQEVIQPGGTNSPIYVKTRGGQYLTIETVNEISENEVDFTLAYDKKFDKNTMELAGSYGGGVARLVRGVGGRWTLAHESMHFLEDAGIIDSGDVAALKGHIKGLVRDGKFETANKKDIGGSEDRANFLADALTKDTTPKGMVGRIIARIREFIDRLVNAFGKRTAAGVVRDVKSGAIFDKKTEPSMSDGADVHYSVIKKILSSTEKYNANAKHSEPPGKDASPAKVNAWIKDETDAIIQTVLNKLPSKLPHMTFLEKNLKSPEWFSHPVFNRIVRLFVRDRNEIYHEYMNYLHNIDDPFNEDTTISEAGRTLKHKGLTWMQKRMGKSSKEYQDLMRVITEGDTTWVRNKKEDLSGQIREFEDHIRKQGISEDTIAVWKLHRESYDRALDMMTQQMREMIEAIEEEAAFKGLEAADYSEMYTTLKGAVAQMETWKGFYAPRIRRPGNWVVQATRGEGDAKEYHREHRGSELAAIRLGKQLRREGWKVLKPHESNKLPEEVYGDLKSVNVAKAIESALEGMQKKTIGKAMSGQTIKFNEELLQEVADTIRARGFRSSMIHRKQGQGVTTGYIEDPMERHILYINNVARGMAKAQVARAALNQLMGNYVNGRRIGGIDPKTESRVYTAAQDYVEEQLRNMDSTDRFIGWAKSLATFKFLGFNARSALVNTTSMVTTAPPAIHEYVANGKVGFMRINRELARAGKDYIQFMRGKPAGTVDEIRFMEEEKRLGWDDPQYTRDALGQISKIQNRAWALTMEASMYLFGTTEKWNRGATMLAAYRIARKVGNNHEEAMELAKTASDKAHGIYGRATLPAIAWGTNPAAKLAQMLYVYGKFSHNYLQMLYDLGFKKHNFSALAYAMIAPIIIGGGAVIPFKDLVFWPLIGMLLTACGAKDKDEDPEKWFWDWTRKQLGKGYEQAGRYGLFGAMGIDLSGSLSIGAGIPKDAWEWAGAIGGVAKEGKMAWHQADLGNYGRAAEHILPTGIANFGRAAREAKQGLTTEKGKRVWDESGKPYMPTTAETLLRMGGFRSSKQAMTTERLYEGKDQAAKYAERRQEIYERYRVYLANPEGERDMKEHKKIRDQVREYNDNIKKHGLKGEGVSLITFESMRRQAATIRHATKNEKRMMQ